MNRKIEIGKKAKVVLVWNVRSFEYSKDKEKEIISDFAKKYGIDKRNITVEKPNIAYVGQEGDETFAQGVLSNIQDPKFQQSLFKKYLDLKEVKDYDFDKILEIDELINSRIDYEAYEKHRRYQIKWIKWSNFMSYGKDNFFDFRNLKGLCLLKSEPANQSGKTTFCLDLIRFLLFGEIKSRGYLKNEYFNRYLPEETELSVEGCVCIDGVDYVIQRVYTRPKLEKRTKDSKSTPKVKYYKLINGEYDELIDAENAKDFSEVDIRQTNKAITEAIGKASDFDLMICVDSGNLKDLISLTEGERGKLLSRWIGLLPLEEKAKIANEVKNETTKKFLSRIYDKDTLENEIKELNDANEANTKELKKNEEKQKETKKELDKLEKEKNKMNLSKAPIDAALKNIDIETLNNEIEILSNEKLKLEDKKKKEQDKLKEYEGLVYDKDVVKECEEKEKAAENEHNFLVGEYRSIEAKIKEIEKLKEDGRCPKCGREYLAADYQNDISEQEKKKEEIIKKGNEKKKEKEKFAKELQKFKEIKEKLDEKAETDLNINVFNVEIEKATTSHKQKIDLLQKIKDNESAIKKNNDIDTKINLLDETIKTKKSIINGCIEKIAELNAEIKLNNKQISEKKKTIEVIIKEEADIRAWDLYMAMVGKSGIKKMIIREASPIINSQLKDLLDGVCDFDVEIVINDNDNIEFNYIHDGVVGKLTGGSGFESTVASLALRTVLSNMSTFSKPSFVVFDEILGGVAEENYEKVKALYDKIIKYYELILQITHLKAIHDWHDTTISVTKENNISRIVTS